MTHPHTTPLWRGPSGWGVTGHRSYDRPPWRSPLHSSVTTHGGSHSGVEGSAGDVFLLLSLREGQLPARLTQAGLPSTA